MPPAAAIVTMFSALVLRLLSVEAASSCKATDGAASSAISGGVPPAAAINTLLCSFMLRLRTAPAASLRSAGDARSAMRGGIPPADAILARFAAFPARPASAHAAFLWARTDPSSAMRGGMPPAAGIAVLHSDSYAASTDKMYAAFAVASAAAPRLSARTSSGIPPAASIVS
jgi:hypothetical protein